MTDSTIRTLRNGAEVIMEANGVVLAINNKKEYVTWLVNFDRNEVSCGHYYTEGEFEEAQLGFIERAFDLDHLLEAVK